MAQYLPYFFVRRSVGRSDVDAFVVVVALLRGRMNSEQSERVEIAKCVVEEVVVCVCMRTLLW